MKKERIKDLLNLQEDNLLLDEAGKKGGPLGYLKAASRDVKKAKNYHNSKKNLDKNNSKPNTTNAGKNNSKPNTTKVDKKSAQISNDLTSSLNSDNIDKSMNTDKLDQKLLVGAWNKISDKTQQENLIKALESVLDVMILHNKELENNKVEGDKSNEE